ncbi:LysE/ArgO family amino acid transporter [Cysteiniphilum sp. JM-1]|uniref:LysE/ArgO family amino acid transporter n=1 Tax=Cysteiniphilum sp. JM-1 TaxID=2610891 RepID=UPI001245F849|nr:LysE family transporter [Cysteiniphilum sp. JM-1]
MAFFTGLLLGLTLIMGIGAQNLFVIKQAITRQYAYSTALICFICDVILITISMFLTATMTHYLPFVRPILLIAAIIFLFYYGALSLKSAYQSHVSVNTLLKNEQPSTQTLNIYKVIFLSCSFSLLNPQAILDIVVLLGGVASKYKLTYLQLEFMAGALSASFIWFFGLTALGLRLNLFFQSRHTWKYLELFSGLFMYVIAIKCIFLLIH